MANLNQHKLEGNIETAGDLVNESLSLADGGTAESGYESRLQTIVTMYQYNRFGQPIAVISPEGNVTTMEYFPENDPDGDSVATPAPADGRTLETDDSVADRIDGGGGYVHHTKVDRTRTDSYVKIFDQCGSNKSSATFFDNNTAPTANDIETCSCVYDDVGVLIQRDDQRGITSNFFVNEYGRVVQTTRASDLSEVPEHEPADPLYGHSDSQQALTAYAYLSRTFFDYNGNVVLAQVEDRGNTSGVDGNGLGTLPSQATDTTPGLSSADGAGDEAWVDSLMLFDRLDDLIESRVEVSSSQALTTKYRYDANRHRMLTIYPEGNADSSVYDERDLLFQSIRGTSTRPTAGLYAAGDPTTFNRAGGSGTTTSTFTYNYDKNKNLVETVDAEDTDSNSSNGSTIAGAGDKTTITYDGFDRRKTVTDADGNISTYFYDPDSNVIRVIQDGDPTDDGVGTTGNKTLSVSEYIHDELSRAIASHSVLFQTPDVSPSRTPTLTDTSAMDSLAPYLNDASSDTASVPNSTGITVIGRVTSISEYDRESRVTFSVQDDLDTYRTDYDGASRVVKTTDDAKSNGFASGAFDPANLDGNTVETAYDDNSNVIERLETDVTTISGVANEAFRTTYIYDSINRLQTVFSTSFVQDGSTSATAQAEDYRYDSRSNLVAKSDAVGPMNTRTFNRRGLGSTASVTLNDFGNVTRTYYDGINRTLQTEAALTSGGQGDGTHVGATNEGVKDSGSVTASNLPTLDTAQSEDGLIDVFYSWDDNSQLLALRDDDGNTTGYIYDNQNRTLKERKGLAETGTSFTLSGGDSGTFRIATRPGSLSDAPVDTESSGTDIVYAYDKDSNVTSTTDEATNVFACSYDALNRKKGCTITRATGFVGTTSQSWKYDGLSRQTQCFDNNDSGTGDDVTCDYFYDSFSRKVEEQQTVGTVGPKAISCSFDVASSGSVGGCSADTYPDGRQTNNTYDRLDRLVDRTDNGQGSAIGTYAYMGKWRVATLTYQNDTRLTHLGSTGGTTDVGFDGLRRIVNHRWESFTTQTPGNGTLLVGFEHQDGNAPAISAYDRANNKKIEFKTHDGTNTFQEQYKYDSVYRLTSVGAGSQSLNSRGFERGTFSSTARTSLSSATFFQDWDLDGLGNWQRQDDNARVETRNHSDFNELTRGRSRATTPG